MILGGQKNRLGLFRLDHPLEFPGNWVFAVAAGSVMPQKIQRSGRKQTTVNGGLLMNNTTLADPIKKAFASPYGGFDSSTVLVFFG